MEADFVHIVFYPFKYFKAEALKLLENKFVKAEVIEGNESMKDVDCWKFVL